MARTLTLHAQELEPRSYSASPVGANFAVVSYGYSTGDVIFDPGLPVSNVHANVSALTLGYGRTFSLFGSTALVTGALPYGWGKVTGQVQAVDSFITRNGIADLRAKLSVNFIGNPATAPGAFAKTAPSRLIVGASVAMVVPTGQYFPDKLINIGANRWAFKPEIGASYSWNARFYLDAYAGVWLYADNRAFYTGASTKAQDPLYTFQLHASYTFRPRCWIAADGTLYTGGATSVDGAPPSARQDNARLGAILAWGLTATQSVKAGVSYGATARVGSDFTSYSLAYQLLWF